MKPSSLNARRRTHHLDVLTGGEVVDVLVVGGGITGAGVALDAALRGLRVALLERGDLAAGTSRWSSKLVHGGLRYLASGDLDLAHESAVERGVLMERTAPHLTRALPMLVPVRRGAPATDVVGLRVGVALGSVLRVAARTSRATLPPPGFLGPERTVRLVPALRPDGLIGGVLNWEGQLVDDARLVVAVARTAASFGARVVTHAEVTDVAGDEVVARDQLSGGTFTVRARAVVNATGVWADRLHPEVALRPSKGSHLVVRGEALGRPSGALVIPVPGERNRYVFALPQADGRGGPAPVLVGLTDDPVDAVADVPIADEADRTFLLEVLGGAIDREIDEGDVIGSFAGLRPLLAGDDGPTADLSRRHRILERSDGLVTLVGGKLTTYRRMARDVVDRLVAREGIDAGPCVTARQPLVGALPRRQLDELPADRADVRRYGHEATEVAALVRGAPALAEPLYEGAPWRRVDVAWAVAHEGAITADDVVDGRLRLDLAPAGRAAAAPAVERLLADPPAGWPALARGLASR